MATFDVKVLTKEIGKLEINYLETKANLESALTRFKNVNVIEKIDSELAIKADEDGIVTLDDGKKLITYDNAKKCRANLNNVAKKINDRKIALKKEFLKPYEVVEAQAKDLISIIDTVNSSIDKQIKDSEEKERELKIIELFNIWQELNFKLVAFDKVFKSKWLNKSISKAVVKKEMEAIIETITNDLKAIDLSYSDEGVRVLLYARYLDNLSLSKTLGDYQIELERKKEIEKIKEEVKEPKKDEPVFILSFEIKGTSEQIKKLSSFLKENKIEYRRTN